MNDWNCEGRVAQRVGILPYIYRSSAQESNYSYITLPTVFSFNIVLGMPNMYIPP
jgi:hypothetical protein